MTSNVYGLLWTLWSLLVEHFCVTDYICLNGLLSWIIIIIIIFVYIYGTFSLHQSIIEFFFPCIYLCYFFLLQGYIYFLKLIVILSWLLIVNY